jgi:hypothetical protein
MHSCLQMRSASLWPIRPADEIDNSKLTPVVKKMHEKTQGASYSSLSNCSGQHIETSLSSTRQSNMPSGDSSLVAVAGPPAADVRRKQGLI